MKYHRFITDLALHSILLSVPICLIKIFKYVYDLNPRFCQNFYNINVFYGFVL